MGTKSGPRQSRAFSIHWAGAFMALCESLQFSPHQLLRQNKHGRSREAISTTHTTTATTTYRTVCHTTPLLLRTSAELVSTGRGIHAVAVTASGPLMPSWQIFRSAWQKKVGCWSLAGLGGRLLPRGGRRLALKELLYVLLRLSIHHGRLFHVRSARTHQVHKKGPRHPTLFFSAQ